MVTHLYQGKTMVKCRNHSGSSHQCLITTAFKVDNYAKHMPYALLLAQESVRNDCNKKIQEQLGMASFGPTFHPLPVTNCHGTPNLTAKQAAEVRSAFRIPIHHPSCFAAIPAGNCLFHFDNDQK